MKKLIFLFVCAVTALQLQGAAADHISLAADTSRAVVCIPAQNGLGSNPFIVGSFLENKFCRIGVGTPAWTPDFGQERCMRHVRSPFQQMSSMQSIIHATSQGTATAINYVAEEDKGKQVKGMILESSLASGNSAIAHTASSPLLGVPTLAKIPFFYYWAPYVAKIFFPFYSPSGKQPIKSMQNFPKQVPIIFAHSKLDPQVSYHDSCALYYAARKNGNPAYLISKEEMGHVGILGNGDQKVVQTMLKKHKLMPGEPDSTVDLTPYQPDHEQFKEVHDTLVRRERNHTYVSYGVTVSMLAGTVAALNYFVLPAAKTFWAKRAGSGGGVV